MNEKIRKIIGHYNTIAIFVGSWVIGSTLGHLLGLSLYLSGCSSSRLPDSELPHYIPPRIFSPRCQEVAEEVPGMRMWCESTDISASQSREACRFIEDYERNCL